MSTDAVLLTDTFIASDEPISSQIDDEIIMMSIEQGEYYSLDAISSRIWGLLLEQYSVADIITQLLTEYAVDRKTCEQDVIQIIQRMLDNKLLVKNN